MCTSPITIKNKRKHFIPGIDKEYLTVPCGHCLECRNEKRNHIYFLSYFEHLQAIFNGGFTQFFTLTYDNNHIPTFGNRLCFSRTDIQRYIKRVRITLNRKLGFDLPIRYIVTCEYGDNTHRPHYHALFFINMRCNHYLVRKVLRDSWYGGFSFGSWDNFGEVNRPQGIRYVTKYVCKDMFDQNYDNEFLDEMYSFSDGHWYRAKRVLPFTLKSKRYGYFAVSHIFDENSKLPAIWRTDLNTLLHGRILCPCHEGRPQLVNIPPSLKRLLFYDITWRYKRVTPRDIRRCRCFGSKVPGHKVQTFYIPNHLYRSYFKNSVYDALDRSRSALQLLGINLTDDMLKYSFVRPEYSKDVVSSDMDFDTYLDRLSDIAETRDPIFKRNYDGSFYYYRAPSEKLDYPDLLRFKSSYYDTQKENELRRLDCYNHFACRSRKVPNERLERIYRDNKILNYA